MSGVQHPVWFDGLQRVVVVDTPPPGQDWNVQVPQVPEGVWWRPKCIVYQLVTSAVVANRTKRLFYSASLLPFSAFPINTAYMVTQASAVQAANLSINYCAAELGEQNGVFSSLVYTLPFDVRLAPGHYIGTFTGNIDAGDQFLGIRLLVQECTFVPPVDYISGLPDALKQVKDSMLRVERAVLSVMAGGSPT